MGLSPTSCPQDHFGSAQCCWFWSELCCSHAGLHLCLHLVLGLPTVGSPAAESTFGAVLQPCLWPCLLLLLLEAHGWPLELVHPLLCPELPMGSVPSAKWAPFPAPALAARSASTTCGAAALPHPGHDPPGPPSFFPNGQSDCSL